MNRLRVVGAALLVNIFERKQEARNPFYRVVELDDETGYRLTSLGRELLRLFLPLHLWSEKWAKAIAP